MKATIEDYKKTTTCMDQREFQIEWSRDDMLSLDTTLAIIIHSALVEFRKYAHRDDGFEEMIKAFEIMSKGEHICGSEETINQCLNGLTVFKDRYMGLWC